MRDKIKKYKYSINISLFFLLIMETVTEGATAPAVKTLFQSMNIQYSPSRVNVSDNGFYVTDAINNTVATYDNYGRLINKSTSFKSPLGIARGKSGKVYIAESGLKRVVVCDDNLNPVGFLGKGENEFHLPNYVAVADVNGIETTFVSDSAADEIKVYQNNVMINRFGSRGINIGQFIFPAGVAINNQNELLVVDEGNERVQIFSPAGIFRRSFSLAKPGVFGASGRAYGIACDRTGRIYVADSLQCSIRVFDENGNYLSSLGKIGFGDGELYNPMDVSVDSYNRLFIASPNNYKIQIMGIDCFLDMRISILSQQIPSGTNLTISVIAACEYGSLQWMKNNAPLANNERISGATSAVLAINSTTADDTGDYYLILSNQNTSITSAPVSVLILAAPQVFKSPTNQIVIAGKTVSFDVQAKGGNLYYQWFFNGVALPGANLPTLILTNVSTNNAGSYYVVVTNILGSATSQVAVLTVIDAPSLEFSRGQSGDLILAWDTLRYVLQSATNISGVWLDVPATTSPLTISIYQMQSRPSMYFRLKKKQ